MSLILGSQLKSYNQYLGRALKGPYRMKKINFNFLLNQLFFTNCKICIGYFVNFVYCIHSLSQSTFFIWNIFPFLNPLCVCLCLNQNAKRVEINHINTYIFQAFNPFQKMKTSVSKGHFPTTKYVLSRPISKSGNTLNFVHTLVQYTMV